MPMMRVDLNSHGWYSSPMPKAARKNPDAARFGMVIRRLRQERGWSIARLAHQAYMNQTHLGVIEAGGNIPSLTTILQLGAAMGINGADIVREVEEMRREAERVRLAAKKAAMAPPPVKEDDLTGS